jgi:hypothetical protein
MAGHQTAIPSKRSWPTTATGGHIPPGSSFDGDGQGTPAAGSGWIWRTRLIIMGVDPAMQASWDRTTQGTGNRCAAGRAPAPAKPELSGGLSRCQGVSFSAVVDSDQRLVTTTWCGV